MDDREILELFSLRSEKAIEEISRKYGGYCFGIAKNILGNDEDTEECVNDAYLKLWDSVHEKKPVSLKLFLAKIVRNLALNRYNEKNCQKRGGGEVMLALDEISELVSGADSTEREAAEAEFMRLLNAFLRSLSERDCGIFINRYFDLYSTAEIAQLYGIKENNVLKILSRIREKLKKYLEKEGYSI